MSDIVSALAAFKEDGQVEELTKQWPKVPLLNLREKGKFFAGEITSMRKVVVAGKGDITYVNAILEDSNAAAVVKTDKKDADGKNEYVPATITKGDVVSFKAPTRLARDLESLILPAKVFIESHGKLSKVEKGRLVSAYAFTVRKKV